MGNRGQLWVTLPIAAALVFAGVSPHPRQKPAAALGAEVTQVDLRAYGWQPHPVRRGEIENPAEALVIDNRDRVLTGVVARTREGLGTPRNPGLVFSILRFDAHGKLDLKLALPASSWHGNFLYLDAADNIIAWADDKIQVLHAETEVGAEPADWKTIAPCRTWRWQCVVTQSQSRQTLLLSSTWGGTPSTFRVLRGSPPGLAQTCEAAPVRADLDAISDAYAYFSRSGTELVNNRTVGVSYLFRWPLCGTGPAGKLPLPGDLAGRVVPLGDDSLLDSAPHDNAAVPAVVYRPDGRLKSSVLLPVARHEAAGSWQLSAGGARLAAIGETWLGGSNFLDISAHMAARRVIVYNMATGKILASIPLSKGWDTCNIAISPDGHVVAAVEGPELTIARVP